MIRWFFALILLTPVSLNAELLVGSALTVDSPPSFLDGDVSLNIVNGDSFSFSEPDLEFVTRTIGADAFLFTAQPGDLLNSETILNFPSIVGVEGEPAAIPVGESFIGFALREPVENSVFHTIGWAKLSRSEDSLEVLANAAEVGSSVFTPSQGIVVGIPEPTSSALALTATFCCWGIGRRRIRRQRTTVSVYHY